jgi:hypothetical protein
MEARPWDEKPSQRSRERSRKDAGRKRARRSRSASVTGMRLSLSEVREGKEAVAMAAAQGRKADAAHPGGRRLKSAKRGRPLRRRLRALGKRRAVRAAEAARMLRTATEWRVAESARCQERQTREAALRSRGASRNWSTVSSTLWRTWSAGGDARGVGWFSSSIRGRFGGGWSSSSSDIARRVEEEREGGRRGLGGEAEALLGWWSTHAQAAAPVPLTGG